MTNDPDKTGTEGTSDVPIGGDWEQVAEQAKDLARPDNPGESRDQDDYAAWDKGSMTSSYQASVSQTLREARLSSTRTSDFAAYLASTMLLRMTEAQDVDQLAVNKLNKLMGELQATEAAMDTAFGLPATPPSGRGDFGDSEPDGGKAGGGSNRGDFS